MFYFFGACCVWCCGGPRSRMSRGQFIRLLFCVVREREPPFLILQQLLFGTKQKGAQREGQSDAWKKKERRRQKNKEEVNKIYKCIKMGFFFFLAHETALVPNFWIIHQLKKRKESDFSTSTHARLDCPSSFFLHDDDDDGELVLLFGYVSTLPVGL